MLRAITLTFTMFTLSACASLSAEECRVADWREIGYTDAANGFTQGRIEDHRNACAKTGVAVQLAPYLEGFNAGLQNYCTVQTALNLGSTGAQFPSQCTGAIVKKMTPAYQAGREQYQMLREQNDLRTLIYNKTEQAQALNKQLQDLASPTLNTNREQSQRLHTLRGFLFDLQTETAQLQVELQTLEAQTERKKLQNLNQFAAGK